VEKPDKKTPRVPDPRQYAIYLLARREYSIGQMRAKLLSKGYEPKAVNALIKVLVKEGLLDDERFAKNAVSSIMRRKPAGRAYMLGYLQKKSISRDMALSIIDKFFGRVDETEMAFRLLQSRIRYLSKFDIETARRKAYNYLSRRAIGYNAAREAFEKLEIQELKPSKAESAPRLKRDD
jgi:regulatory protein